MHTTHLENLIDYKFMIVMKFGGTSVKDASAIRRTLKIVESKNDRRVVVVSAFAGVTNKLVSICDLLISRKSDEALKIAADLRSIHLKTASELNLSSSVIEFINQNIDELCKVIYALDVIGEISNKSKDMIYAIGETLSSYIIAEYAKNHIHDAIHIDSRKLIRTDSNFTEAEVDFESSSQLINDLLSGSMNTCNAVFCGGFIASDKFGNTTTLGRGGSDYSAAVIAKCLNAGSLEIWTDVDGILTSDPRVIHNAMLLREISYIEASELAYFGANVLHPKTIYPAIESNIPVYVLNSYNPESTGTLIKKSSPVSNIIKAIAFRRNITIINITSNRMLGAYGFLAKVFDVFLLNETSVDLVTTSEVSISLTIDNDNNLDSIIRDLQSFSSIDIIRNRAVISAVGEGIRNTSGIASKFFGAINGVNISMISMGASEVNLSIIVAEEDLENAVKLLHKEFFEKEILPELFVKLNRIK